MTEGAAVLTASENAAPACEGDACSPELKAACEQTGVCPMSGMSAKTCQSSEAAAKSGCPMGGGDCQQACPHDAPQSGAVAEGEKPAQTDTQADSDTSAG
ncbi:MAG: hypothetical protein IPJ41_13185 [Phycisphaerales bacterium]|nr:hypothetical protein [Phycisphaerales bacterium]